METDQASIVQQPFQFLRHVEGDLTAFSNLKNSLKNIGILFEDRGVAEQFAQFEPLEMQSYFLVDVRWRQPLSPFNNRMHPCLVERIANRIIWYCDQQSFEELQNLETEDSRGEFFLVPPFLESQVHHCLRNASDFYQHRHSCMVSSIITSDFIMAYLNDAILVSDQLGIINYVNHEACRITGMPMLSLMYAKIEDVLQIVEVETNIQPDASGYPASHSNSEWCKVVQSSGLLIPVEKWEIPFMIEQNNQSGTIIGMRDNSSEQEYINRIERAKLQAEQAAHAKNEFLANISHELRTPLNGILGMTELAIDLAKSREQEEYLRILKVSADSLYDLITSMLDYVKLESGTFNIRERVFQLQDTIDAISANFSINCHAKHLGFYIVTNPDDRFSYIGDETRINQIITNLLSNALKFTDKGDITLSIKELEDYDRDLSEKFKDCRPLEIRVQDSGIGIPSDRLWDIFQSFTQIEQTTNRNLSGTGIGLTITKMLVEAMGGKIKVTSELGKGSVFSCTVWIKPGGQRRALDGQIFPHNQTVCLLISENEGWVQSIMPWLDHVKLPVRLCRDIQEFDASIREFGPNHIICIFHGSNPKVDQVLDYARQSDQSELWRRKHIVTLRIPRKEEYHWQMAPFAFKIIFEPIRPSSLYSLLKELDIERSRDSEQTRHKPFNSEYQLNLLYAEDEEHDRQSICHFLQEAGHRVTAVPDGSVLLDTLKAASFDMIIVDIQMPELNGYEAISMVRSGGLGTEKKKIPVVALTAHDTMQDRQHAELLGMNAFLAKPYSVQSLLLIIDRVWEQELSGGLSVVSRGRKSVSHDLITQILDAIHKKHWENAQNLSQDLRKLYKENNNSEQAERCFRLVLAIRRQDSETACKILDEVIKQKGDHHESTDR